MTTFPDRASGCWEPVVEVRNVFHQGQRGQLPAKPWCKELSEGIESARHNGFPSRNGKAVQLVKEKWIRWFQSLSRALNESETLVFIVQWGKHPRALRRGLAVGVSISFSLIEYGNSLRPSFIRLEYQLLQTIAAWFSIKNMDRWYVSVLLLLGRLVGTQGPGSSLFSRTDLLGVHMCLVHSPQ